MKNVVSIQGNRPVDVIRDLTEKVGEFESVCAIVMTNDARVYGFLSKVPIQDLVMMQATLEMIVRERMEKQREI